MKLQSIAFARGELLLGSLAALVVGFPAHATA